MAVAQWLAIVLGVYGVIVIAFETLVMVMGARQAARGLEPDEDWLAISTSDANGSRETIVAGVESDGQLYISANHWLRGWHRRALENPEIEVTRNGVRLPYRAIAVSGAEREGIVRDYRLPWAIRFLTGFPPRLFLRLDARPG